MSQWQIESQEYLKRLGLDQDEFERQLKLPRTGEVKRIVPLREIKEVQSIIPINSELLLYLVKKIRTFDGQLPFQNSTIRQVVVNSNQLKIGQKYVYRENYQQILESISDIFRNFLGEWGGLGNLGAYFVFGLNGDGGYSMA